jgi:hypothetical protein
MGTTFDDYIPLLPAKVSQHGVDAMNGVRDQDAFIQVGADESCDSLTALCQRRAIFQSHELVRVGLDLVRYGFAGLYDWSRNGPIRS